MTHALVETTTPRSSAPAVCRCGKRSDNDLPSYVGRDYWLRQHRREVLRGSKSAAWEAS